MEISEFAKVTYPLFGFGETQGEYLRTLLINVTKICAPTNKAPYITSESTLRSCFNGRRSMGKIARHVLGYIDIDRFYEYLSNFDVDSIEMAAIKLTGCEENKNKTDLIFIISSQIQEALYNAALINAGPKKYKKEDRLSIEREVKSLLGALVNVNPYGKTPKLAYKALKVRQKISENANKFNNLLIENIENMVVKHYRFIENQLKIMDGIDSLSSKKLLTLVKAKYYSLAEDNKDCIEIYYGIRAWLLEEANSNEELAAEILTAFFVQNCEVFDASPK